MKLLKLGRCHKPHGIKGAFSFHLFNNEDSCLKKGMEVHLTPLKGSKVSQAGEVHTISKIQFGNKTIVYLKDVDDRNLVEDMIPFEISIDKELLPKLDQNEYYLDDLIGLEVRENGENIGKIVTHYSNGVQVVVELKIRGEKMDLPFIDDFFPELNVEEGYVTFNSPEEV